MNLNTHENLLKKSIIKWMQKCLLLKRLVDTGNYSFRTYNPLVLCILLLLGAVYQRVMYLNWVRILTLFLQLQMVSEVQQMHARTHLLPVLRNVMNKVKNIC